MGFPSNPTDGQLYVNDNNSVFIYESASNKWKIATLENDIFRVLDLGAPISSGYRGKICKIIASGTITAGETVNFYNNSGIKARKACAENGTVYPADGIAITGGTDVEIIILLDGQYSNGSYTLTIGATVYLSITAGGLTCAAPTGTGQIVQILGKALTATTILLNPNSIYITLS